MSFTGDFSTQYIVENGYLLLYIAPTRTFSITTASHKYGLCSLVKSSGIHMVLFDEPSSITEISVSDTNYTFYELSYIDTFPRDKYVPNPPELTTSLITQLIRRNWNPPVTEFLYAIISLHGTTYRIQDLIDSNLPIDWGYIDSNGDTFLHRACNSPQNAFFLQIIIQNLRTHKKQLINHSNNAKQTPLALLTRYIYDNSKYALYCEALKILLNNGAKIIIQDLNTQMMRPIMRNFTIQQHNQSLVIAFTVQQTTLSTSYSMYALFSNRESIHIIETKYLTPLNKDFSSIFRNNFIQILDLNCPEILDYIFDPNNSISKTKIDQSQSGESFLNIAAGECNSPLLFEYFIQDITDWNLKDSYENILHICLSKMKYKNFYLLLVKIPLEDLNKLLFTPNDRNLYPITSMMDIANTEKCTQLLIRKGCLDENGNNLAHIAISNKKYDFLRLMIKSSQTKKHTFTHKNKDGFNPLHLAIQKYSIEATHLLLENSDKHILTSTDNGGYNCLHSAILHFNIDIFKAVLGVVIKCDAVSEDKIINIKTKDTTKTPFLLSIEKQCLEITRLLLSHGASIDIQDYKSQYFPYYIQYYCLNKDSLQKVLGLKVNQLNRSTLKSECCIEDLSFNKSPLLFYFWKYQDLDRFKEICAAFSFRNLVKCNQDGNTILHVSLYNDKLTEYLLEVFSHLYNDYKKDTICFLDSINKKYETALSLAVTHSKPEAVQKILKLGASLQIGFPGGDNILHIAIRTKNRETIAIFLCHPEIGQLLCKPNKKNETPITSLLKSDGTDAINAVTNVEEDIHGPNGESILHLVVQNGDEQTLLELIQLKGFPWSNLKDNNKRTPLHYAVVFSKAYAIKLLVGLGYDTFTPDAGNKTVVDYSIEKKSSEIWSIIFPIFCSAIESRYVATSTLKNLLQVCIKNDNEAAFTDILTLTPDIDAVDSEGNTLLHHAAEYPEQSKILTSLIEYIKRHYNDRFEQLFSILNNNNLAPFHYAIWNNNLSAIDIFISHKAPFVIEMNSKLTLCALNSPLSINLSKRNNQLTIGYKVTPKSPNPPVWILSEIPDMKRDAIKKLANTITKVDRLTDLHIKTILQCPSAEPVIAFLNQKLIQESRTFYNGCSLLLFSAMYGTLSVVNELCKTMDLSFTDQNTETILFYALKNKDTEVPKFLLNSVLALNGQRSTDILNAENKKGERILEVALDNFERFSIFLDGKFQIILTYTAPNECTLLHTITRSKRDPKFIFALLTEIQRRKEDCLNKFINISSKDLPTALHLCVFNNLETNLRELLKFSPNITCQDQNGNTPLHIASELNFKSLLTILIEHVKSIQGDYPSFINAVNKEKMTPLHVSIISSNLEIAKELLTAGAELYATDNSGRTVLHHAVLIKDVIKREKAINFLFQQEKEQAVSELKLIQIQDTSDNDSPLHLAVLHSNNKTIQLLLKESPDLTLCDKYRKTVLHKAITEGHLEIIQSILSYVTQTYPEDRVDPLHVLNLQDKDKNTALHLAISGNRYDILKELLPLNPLLNLKNNSGRTPLHLAVSNKLDILKDILEEINKYSKEQKESYFYALDNTGLPPLHYAIVHNHLQSVRPLIESGAGLAWCENIQHITLFNDIEGLSLCFCRLKRNKLAKFITKFTGYNIFVGYRMVAKNVWVVALLPALTEIWVFENDDIEELTDELQDTKCIEIYGKCASVEPIKAVIQKVSIDDERLNKIAVSNDSHGNVRDFLITRNCATKSLCCMLREGVSNNDSFDSFEQILKLIPTKRDDPNSMDEDIREISITMCKILPLSLKNDTIDALKKLLTLDPLLTHLYGEKNDSTLLHLMVEMNKSSDFLKEYLEKVKVTEEQHSNTKKRIVDFTNSNSLTALNMSIEKEQLKNIQTILSYEPNVFLYDASDNSSLHFAAKTGNLKITQLIIDHILDRIPSYSFDHTNSDGCTPLHLATESGNVEICELLLAKGADCYSTDNTSRTVLHHAILIQDVTQRKSMVEFILENSDNKIVRMPDHQSCIPLQRAVVKRQVSVVELLVPFTDTIKHKNIDKQTALHLSCIHRCDKIVDLIVEEIIQHENGNVIDLMEKNMKTALHLSIENKNHHALEKVLTAKLNLELVDASENNYLHKSIEVVDDPFFLRTILSNLSENTMKNLLTRLNNIELPPLQYAILNKNYLAADILVGKGAKLDFLKEGKSRLCDDIDKLKLKVVEYKSQYWVGFEIQTATKSHFVITQLPSLEGDTYVSADESHNIKSYTKETIKDVMRHISACESSDPFNNLLQNGHISLEDNFQEIGKSATKVVIQKFFDSNKNALYHQASGESMIESAVSNPNLDAFEFLLSNLPEFQQKDISSVNPTDSKDAQISLCVKNSLRKSLSNTNTKILKSLLKRFTKINYLYPNEETLIQLAISQGNSPDFLEAIFEKVGKDGTETDIDGISLINKQSKYKEQTALHICIAKKQKDNMGVLLNNSADPFLCDSEANTALHYSVLTNELNFVETVYNATKEKSELLQQTNVDNHSALHLAVKGENPKIVDFLLRSSSPFYPVMDKEPTVLHLAIRIGNESAQTEIMNHLFKHEDAGHVKFPMTQLKDDRGYPPLHLATDLRNNNAVTLLLKTDPSVLYIQDTRGHTPLHISLIQSTSDIKVEVKYFSIFETIIGKILALRDENPDLLAQNVITPPLHEETPCTCKVDNVFCTQDKDGKTAMHYAIQYGRIEAFKQLLYTKSCLFIPDEDGYTLQHEAVKNDSNIQFLELLEEELMARTGGSHLECFRFETDPMDQTKSHQVPHCKPKCQLPPLQLAIKENNLAAIQSMLKRNYGIAFKDNENHVILSEHEKDLPIQLLYIPVRETYKYTLTFHVGFEFKERSKSNWVVADLPNLNNVRITKSVSKMEPRYIQEMLPLLVRCKSPRPLFAACRGLIEPNAQLKDKSFLRDLICENGSEQVVVEYITEFGEVIFKEIDKFLSMIESAINNPKVLGYLLTASSNLQTSDSFNPAHKQLISKCLYKCLELSIECNGVAALQILLLHHSCVINSLYEEKSDTLLQLALRKKGKIEFIKCILKALSDRTEVNLTHIKDENSVMIPLIDWKNNDNHTALHICVQNECNEDIVVNAAILEELLSSNARINYTDEGADTIVHFIVKKRKAPILAFKILMKIHHISDHALTHFGDLPFLDAKDKDGKTAIHVCIENRNKDLLKTLLTFAHDTLSQDPNGDTALHLAVYTQDLEFVEIVNFHIEHTIIEARNNKGYTALHCAINYAKNTIADHLLKCGADFFTTDDNKQSILHHAIKLPDAHCKQMIEYIIAYNNEPIITKMLDKDNNCPLHLAVILQNIIAVKILLDWDSSILCCKEKDNRSVLHLSILVESRNPVREEILDYILEKIKFLENNTDQWLCNRVIDYQDNFQKAVLHYCILHNNGSALMKLLALSPNLGLKDNLGNTPLHQAVLNHEHVLLLQPLLDSIKDNNELKYSSNSLCFRPLQLAISQNNLPAIETLINDRNKFQLAYPPDSDTQTLCDGIGHSSLRFLSKTLNSTTIYTGYLVKYRDKEYWVMAKLPELKVTVSIISDDCLQHTEICIEVLLSVLECRSQDPLKAVFENKMCQVDAELSNELFLSQLVSQHSTQSVMEYYLTKHCTTLHTFPPNRKSMIESSICNTKNIDTIRLLLSKVNTDNPDVKKCLHNSLEISLANEGEEALSLLLEYTSALNDSYGPKNYTLLHLIIENNKASTFISCLLDKVEDIESKTSQSTFISNSPFIDVKNSDSKTALHIVIENEDMGNLRKLLEYGPSLKIPDDRGDTPLHYAVYTNNIDIVGVILNQINRDNPEIKELKNIQGCTPLHCAVIMENLEITKLLIEKDCDFLATDCMGRTMLHYAVIIPQPVQTISKMVNYILKHDELHHNHILLKSTDFKEHTPLHLAVIEKQELVIDQILEAIDNAELKFDTSWIVHRVICYQDCEQKTALHLSIQCTNSHALNVLLNKDPCLDLKDHNKNSILHTATINPSDEYSVERILDSIKRRFQRNFDDYLYEAINDQNLTPLQFAIKNGHIFAVKAMVEEDTQIAYKRDNKTTLNFTENLPLHFFCSKTEEFYIGYSFMSYGNSQDENFVICRLPLPSENIPKTEISNPSEVGEINLDSYTQELLESLLQQIFKSQTEEPLQAFHFLCDLTTMTELSNQSTLLHFAAQFGTEQVMEYLIEKSKVDCDFKATDGNGNGIFHRAIHNEIDNVHFLIEKVKELVANRDEFSEIIDIKNRNSLCALDTALAADSKDVFLKYTKEDYNAKLNYYDPTGNTLLHKIVLKNDKNTETYLEVLLDAIRDREKMNPKSTFINGVALIDCYSWKCEQEYYTALQLGILVGNFTALEILFRYGANILLTTMHSGFSIIHLAILHQQNNPEYLRTILVECIEKKEPSLFNRKDSRGSHWLDYYLENGTVPIVSLQSTYDIEKYITGRPCTTFGLSPLHLAISQESYECVEILLQGLDKPNEECTQASHDQLYVRDPNGYTALHYATLLNCEGAVKIIDILFDSESSRLISDRSILTQRCNNGTTPLHTAISKGSHLQITLSTESAARRILDVMLHYSTKFNPDGISYLDNHNRSILHDAVIAKNDEIFGTVFECVKQYIHSADLLNLQDYDGKTALHLAVEYDYLFAFQEIVKSEPALNLRDKVNHWTVLHSIIGNNRDEIFFNDYLKGNSNHDLMDVNGLTALHLAIKQKRTKFVNELMANGAKLSIEIGDIGCGMYTVGASVEKDLLLLGRTEGETHLQSNKYIVAYKVEAEFLFSTLPELSDSESAENKRGFLREKDVEFEKLSVEETESLISSCFASKCPELVEKLIELGKIDFTGDTKLMHLAAQHASLPVMKFLCEKKQPDFDYESIDSHGNTLIHCGAKNTIENVETLIYILNQVQEFESKKKKVVSQKILKVRNYKNQSALQITIDSGKFQLFIALIKHGADIKETNQFGNSILHILIQAENKTEDDIFKNMSDLIEQFKKEESLRGKISDLLNIKNNQGDAVLQIAIEESYKQLIQLFIDNSASLSVIQRNSGNTIVHLLIKNQPDYNTESIEYVLKAVKIHDKERKDDQILDRRNLELCTALHISVQDKKKIVSTKLLLDAGVPIEIPDRDGNTALHIATRNQDYPAVQVLMSHQKKKELLPLNPLMNSKNNSGQTPLHLAVFIKPEILNDILEEINKYSEEKKESYFYALDNTGLPPLHSAIVHNNLKSVRALIDCGAGLAWHKNERHITLFNDTNGLSLCFCRLKKANTYKKLITHFTVNDIFVGYQMIDKNVWVVALLPGLTQTCVFPIQDIEQLTTTLEEAYILKSIVKCASTEPIKVGIQKGQIDDQKLDSEGNNWLKNFVISENGHKNVKTFVTFHNSSSRDLCAKLRTGVRNNDCFDVFEDVVEFIPVIRDDPESENEDIREISRTLLEVLPLSLENDKIDSLKKLLSLNPLLTHLYGENNDSTLLHLMVEKNKSSEFLEEYLEKVKIKEEQNPPTEKRLIDSKNSNSMTVLNLSIKMKQLQNIKTILSYKPNIYPCDASDNSILHFATKTNNLEIAQLITNYISNQNPSYSFDLRNSDGCTPLHLATESGNVEICELLLSKGADCYSTDNTSKTILHNAISIQDDAQRKSMIEFILQNTVNSDNKIVRMPDNQSCIPLQCAVAKGQVSVVELLVPFTDTIKHKNIDKQTALHLSCIHRCDKIVDLIVEEIKKHEDGNVIDLREKNMKTALHLSIDNKNHHALEKVLKAKPNLELIDASKNNYLHNAIEVVDDPFFLRTILTNLSEDSIQNLFTRLNSVELPPLQYAILNKNYLAADILVGKGAKLDFQKEGKRRLCNDTDKLKLKVVEYKSQCWVGFEILIAKDSHFVITQLPSLEGDTCVSANDSWSVKPYSKKCISRVMQQICECESSDPFQTLLQNGLISLENNFQQIAKFATKEVIRTFFDSNKNALYHQSSGESMIESAVSNPNIDAFEFLLSKLPEFQQEDVSSANPTDSKDVQISLCVKNSLRKSLKNTNTRILKCLLKRFTKINHLYLNEETLIHLAISQGNCPDFLEAIFENVGKDGTDIGSIGFVNQQSIDKKHTALHICIAKKQKENLKVLLRNSADLFLCDSEANTALHYSVLTNELNFVETIYNATQEQDKAKLLQQTNTDNHSALHLAVKGENPKIVDFLLRSSSLFYPVMDKEPTLLHLAIRIRNELAQTEIMNQLFKHEDAGHNKFPMTRLKDDRGYPPLHLATDLRNNDAIILLLKVDPSVLYIQDTRGHTPLHISLIQSTSCTKDEVKDYSIFETINGKILALRNENRDLPAQNAITPPLHEETPCTCKVDNVFCTQDNRGRTAMHYAIQYGRIEAFKQLLDTKSCLFIPDEDGYTLQHEAVKNGSDIQFLELLEEELMARTGGSHLECFKFKRDCS